MLEVRAPLDWATVLLRMPSLLRAPRGDGRPVMLLPGFGTDELSMRPLGRYLRYLGYDVYDWGLGRNRGRVNRHTRQIGARRRQPASLPARGDQEPAPAQLLPARELHRAHLHVQPHRPRGQPQLDPLLGVKRGVAQEDLRCRALKTVLDGKKQVEVAKMFDVTRQAVG